MIDDKVMAAFYESLSEDIEKTARPIRWINAAAAARSARVASRSARVAKKEAYRAARQAKRAARNPLEQRRQEITGGYRGGIDFLSGLRDAGRVGSGTIGGSLSRMGKYTSERLAPTIEVVQTGIDASKDWASRVFKGVPLIKTRGEIFKERLGKGLKTGLVGGATAVALGSGALAYGAINRPPTSDFESLTR